MSSHRLAPARLAAQRLHAFILVAPEEAGMAEVHEPPPCIQQPAPPWQRRRSYTAAATPASRHSDAGGVPGAKTKARPTSIQSVWVPVVRWRYVSMQCTKTTSPARMSKKTHHHDGTRLPADIRGLTAASALCSWAHGLLCRPEAAWSASSSNHIIETCFI